MSKVFSFPVDLEDFDRIVRPLSLAARWACFDTLRSMQSPSSRGRLTLNAEGWARFLSCTVEQAARLRTELVERTPFFEVEKPGNGDVAASGNEDVTLVCPLIIREETSREATRSRVARFRERARNATRNVSVSPSAPLSSRASEPSAPTQDPPLPAGAAPRAENGTEKRRRKTPFHPPSLEEIRAYWREKKLSGDPDAYFDWKEAHGWPRVVDWRADARSWSRREPTFSPKSAAPTRSSSGSRDLQEVMEFDKASRAAGAAMIAGETARDPSDE
jgi:hypothetical protein